MSDIVLSNAASLKDAVETCSSLGIGAFRISSSLLPLATHPVSGYSISDLRRAAEIHACFDKARDRARELNIRLSFHPDQFVVLNSESDNVVASSVKEMNHQAEAADLVGAEALTLHGGGKGTDKQGALDRLARGIDRLSDRARRLLALENDDRVFSPADLLPFCEKMGIPLVYDVHHHRCLPDGLSIGEVSDRCARSWGEKEPWMHISSPRDGWASANPRSHAGFIDPNDVPDEWKGKLMTIDVEAKEKERAVLAVSSAMRGRWHR